MRPQHVEREILAALADEGSLHVRELNATLTAHPASVDQACSRLHDEGNVAPVGLGVYELTEQGRRLLEELSDEQPEVGQLEG